MIIQNTGVYILEKLVVTGKTPLKGEVVISGAKNAAVAILPAIILAQDVCRVENIPAISDVEIMIKILQQLADNGNTILIIEAILLKGVKRS